MIPRLSTALATLRWGPYDVAAVAGIHERTVRRWLKGTSPMSEPVLEWLETLAAAHDRNPAPIRRSIAP